VRLFAIPVEPLLLQNLGSRFLLGGESYDTPSVTVATTMLYSVSLRPEEACIITPIFAYMFAQLNLLL
jgi:hypothetical protein